MCLLKYNFVRLSENIYCFEFDSEKSREMHGSVVSRLNLLSTHHTTKHTNENQAFETRPCTLVSLVQAVEKI